MTAPFFSVIIPCYNRRSFLDEALDSLWQQSFRDFEVIVVDDGSTDGTREYLDELGGRVRWLSQDNLGPGAARNRGLEIARGSYVAFLDSDDLWFPWTLTTYEQLVHDYGAPSLIVGKPLLFQTIESLPSTTSEIPQSMRFADYYASGAEWRWRGMSSFVVRLEALRAVGGFLAENMNGEDADLALRLGEERGFVQVHAPVTFGYRLHTANVTDDLHKNIAGVRHMIRAENHGEYPGGRARAVERRHILTRHVRPVSLACLRDGEAGVAWELYRCTFSWHVQLWRWKYVVGFPLMAALRKLRRRWLAFRGAT